VERRRGDDSHGARGSDEWRRCCPSSDVRKQPVPAAESSAVVDSTRMVERLLRLNPRAYQLYCDEAFTRAVRPGNLGC
jgi:hypothetical protein